MAGTMPGHEKLIECVGLRTPARASASIAFEAGSIPHHGEVAAFRAALAFIALHARLGAAIENRHHYGFGMHMHMLMVLVMHEDIGKRQGAH